MQYRGLKFALGIVLGTIFAFMAQRIFGVPGLQAATAVCGILAASNFCYAVRVITRP